MGSCSGSFSGVSSPACSQQRSLVNYPSPLLTREEEVGSSRDGLIVGSAGLSGQGEHGPHIHLQTDE